jgi:hypothetical protein
MKVVSLQSNCIPDEKIAAFVDLTAVTKKSAAIFWDMTPCSVVEVHRCFEGTH